MRVKLPAEMKEESVKTSGVVKCYSKVEVLLKMDGTAVQKTSCSVAGGSVYTCVVGFKEKQLLLYACHSQTVYE